MSNIGSNKSILDVGCNDGYIGNMSDSTNKFYGLDYSAYSIRKVRKIYSDAVIYDLNKLEKLSWNIKFDTIIFADVLEHVLYPEKVLKYFIDNYLKNSGEVIISLPNIANWQIRFSLLFGRFNYTEMGILDKTHLHIYTFKSASQLIERAGLKVIEELSGASFFGYPIKTFPFLRSLLATNIIIIAVK